jgi:hypothetical protein
MTALLGRYLSARRSCGARNVSVAIIATSFAVPRTAATLPSGSGDRHCAGYHRASGRGAVAVLGCHKLLEPGDGPALIFDIGGGSTELVLIDQDEGVPRIRAWWSAPWGVVSLTESEGKEALEGPDRILAYKRMRERARRAFANFATMLPEGREGIRLLGTSGTVTTLASVIALQSYDRRAVDGACSDPVMQKIGRMIANVDYEERSALPPSATSARTSSSPAAPFLKPSWKSGLRKTSSQTAASAKESFDH